MSSEISKYIRDVKDFPKPGIIFKDITTLLKDPVGFKKAGEKLYEFVKDRKIDKIAGIESRGFIYGALLAEKLGAGLVLLRKPNKLPAETLTESYELEYGTDTIEMHKDAIEPGEKVLVHDDLLATGGTAAAACKLIEKAGGEIVQVQFLLELKFLNGREKLSGYEIRSIVEVD